MSIPVLKVVETPVLRRKIGSVPSRVPPVGVGMMVSEGTFFFQLFYMNLSRSCYYTSTSEKFTVNQPGHRYCSYFFLSISMI
jgi:hypothetical protein